MGEIHVSSHHKKSPGVNHRSKLPVSETDAAPRSRLLDNFQGLEVPQQMRI
jgi:hypothetical protein